MKILFISTSSGSRGGGELYLLYLGMALRTQGFEVGVWCSSHPRMDELANAFCTMGVVFRSDYTNTYDYLLRSIRYLLPLKRPNLAEAIKVFTPDVLHLNKQNTEDGLDLIRELDEIRIPYVTTIHITQSQSQLNALMGKLRDLFSRRILRSSGSKKWIAVSSSRVEDLAIFMGSSDKTISIPNGVTMPEYRNDHRRTAIRHVYNIKENELVLISVGRLEAQKNPIKFLAWAKSCCELFNNLKFLWIGDGSMKLQFENSIKELGLAEKVICVGWQKDVNPFYEMADIYIHTADFEGLAFSILEAMSWGIPCVTTSSLFKDIKFPSTVIRQDLEGLTALLEDGNDRMNMGVLAKNFIKEHYSWDEIVQSYLQLYKNIA